MVLNDTPFKNLYLSICERCEHMVVAMEHMIKAILKSNELVFLQSHTPGQVWYRESQLLKILGLRDHLGQLRGKVHYKLTVFWESYGEKQSSSATY